MNLFQLNTKTYEIDFEPQTLLLKPFKDLFNRDRSKSKDKAKKELAFIWFYTDIKSDYQYITDDNERIVEIVKDLQLGKDWKIDDKLNVAIEFYKERSSTIKSTLYRDTCSSVTAISTYLKNTTQHLIDGVDITKITSAVKSVPIIMQDLDKAYKEVVKEQKETEGRSKGSKAFNLFEDGL